MATLLCQKEQSPFPAAALDTLSVDGHNERDWAGPAKIVIHRLPYFIVPFADLFGRNHYRSLGTNVHRMLPLRDSQIFKQVSVRTRRLENTCACGLRIPVADEQC